MQTRARTVSSMTGAGKTGELCARGPSWIPTPHHTYEAKAKWMEDLNVKSETVKPLAEIMGSKLLDLAPGGSFLDRTPKALEMKAKIHPQPIRDNRCQTFFLCSPPLSIDAC